MHVFQMKLKPKTKRQSATLVPILQPSLVAQHHKLLHTKNIEKTYLDFQCAILFLAIGVVGYNQPLQRAHQYYTHIELDFLLGATE